MVTDTQAISWLKAHERMVIVFLVLVFGTFVVQRWFDHSATVDSAKAATTQAVLVQQLNSNTQLAQQTASQVAQYQAMVAQLAQQNASLLSAIQNDNAVLKQRQTQDKTLPPDQLAQRWAQLVPGTQPSATPTGVAVTTPDAQATVSQLEEVPTLTDQLSKETTIANNNATQLQGCTAVTTDQAKQIAGLNTQIVDADKAYKAEISAVKAQARKSKLRWFFAGVLTGIGLRGAL